MVSDSVFCDAGTRNFLESLSLWAVIFQLLCLYYANMADCRWAMWQPVSTGDEVMNVKGSAPTPAQHKGAINQLVQGRPSRCGH
jgi:hypothetical protein